MEPPTAAPYGHACANCVRSKCKCVIRQGKNTCERCSRLGKECLPATQVRKRGTRSTPVPKRAKLEDKLDSLVTLLQVQNSNVPQVSFQQDSNSIGPDQTPSLRYNKVVSGQAKPVGNTREFHPSQQTHLDSLYYEVAPPTNFSASSSISTLNSAASSDGTLSLDERPPPRYDSAINSELKDLDNLPAVDRSSRTDGQTLQFFRTSYLPNFPCVILPPDGSLDTESFKRSNPFLWRNIQAVCEPSLDRLRDLGVQIREYAARKVVVEGERSLDFLTGLLIHVSWAHFFARGTKPHLGMMSSIIRSLVADLRLDGYPGAGDMPPPLLTCPKLVVDQGVNEHTFGELRALLGCFIISAGVSSLLQYESMRWGSRMEEAAAKLNSTPEYLNDQVLSALARLSHVADDAAKVIRYKSEESFPAISHIKPLVLALEKVRSSLPSQLLSNKTVLCTLYNAEVMVYEISTCSKRSPTISHSYDARRIEYMHCCFEAARSSVNTYLSFDIAQLPGMNFFIMLQVLHSIHILFRLSVLEDPEWDNSVVRNATDVISCLDQICSRLDKLHMSYSGEGDSVWSNGAQKLRTIIPIWRANLGHGEDVGSTSFAEFASDPTLVDHSWLADFFPFNLNGQLEGDQST